MDNITITASEMNKVPISDFLSAVGFNCLEQIGSLRHYHVDDGVHAEPVDLTVNTTRNEWIDRNDRGKHGLLTGLIEHLELIPDNFDGNYHVHMGIVLEAYKHAGNFPTSYPTATVRLGSAGTTIKDTIGDEVSGIMARRGLSENTINKYCKQLDITDRKDGTVKHMLAFPADNGKWYAFTGTSWRPVTDGSITTIGEFKKNQYLYVYDNPMDYLAMMEKWHRNRVENAFGSAYHLILNGRQNIKEACQFIKDNPDFLSVKTFLPDNTDGRQLFAEIDDASKGTSVNCSYIYNGFTSLSDQMRMRIPSDIYEQYLAPKKESQSQTIGQSKGQGQSQTTGLAKGKAGNVSRQTNVGEKEKNTKEKLSDRPTRGKGPVQTIILKRKRKGWGL